MLIDVTDNGAMLYFVLNDYLMMASSYVVSQSDFLSQFILEKYI